jgi:hypothetical protein
MQMVQCRSVVMAMESVMEFEYNLMRRFVCRGHSSMCPSFSFFISFNDCLGTHYLRCLENGHFIGLGSSLLCSFATVCEIVMNHNDRMMLTAQRSRRQQNDFDVVVDKWETVREELIDSIGDKVYNLSFCFVADNSTRTFVQSFNCDHVDVNAMVKNVAKNTAHDLPSFETLLDAGIADVEDSRALNNAINCLPNISIDTDPQKKVSQSFYWQLRSVRNGLLGPLAQGMLTKDMVAVAVDSVNKTLDDVTSCSTASRSRTGPSSTGPSRTRRRQRARNADSIEHAVPFDIDSENITLSGYEEGGSIRCLPSLQTKSLVSRVRSALIDHGLFRLLRNDVGCIQVVWNSYDARTGDLRRLQFSTTTVSFPRSSNNNKYVCEKCPSFNNSIELDDAESDDDGVVVGFCAHTNLLGILVPHLRVLPGAPVPHNDHFVTWVQANLSSNKSVITLFDDGGLGKFFVKVGDGLAHLEHTSEVAVCNVWIKNSGPGRVSCSVSQCTEVTMKGVQKAKSSKPLCCHLRSLLDDDDHKLRWGACFSHDGYDAGSMKDLDDAMQGLEGIFFLSCTLFDGRVLCGRVLC